MLGQVWGQLAVPFSLSLRLRPRGLSMAGMQIDKWVCIKRPLHSNVVSRHTDVPPKRKTKWERKVGTTTQRPGSSFCFAVSVGRNRSQNVFYS